MKTNKIMHNSISHIAESDFLFKSSNGKSVCFAQYGDLAGSPLVYFHGWPSSRLEAKKYDPIAKKLGIRIIAPDRPGYGRSDFVPGSSFLDWAKITTELASALSIRKFSIVGNSGGGPYAVLCAYYIPHKIHKLGITVGLAPTNIDGVLEGMALWNKIIWRSYHYVPPLLFLSPLIHYLKQTLFPRDVSEAYPAKKDNDYFTYELKQAYIENRREAYRQGIWGASHDLKLYTSAWNIDFKKIHSKVFLWYGALDKNVSIAMGEFYRDHIPSSKLIVFPKCGHMVLLKHTEEIFQTLK